MSIPEHERQVIRDAIQYLAAVCDHAVSRDSVGFSAATAGVGHELANLPDRYWTDGFFALAAQVAAFHRRQILDRAVSEADLGAIERIAAYPSAAREDVPVAWAIYDLFADAVTLSVSSEHKDFIKLLKRIPGAFQPAGRGRVWTVPGPFTFPLAKHVSGLDCESGVVERIGASNLAATDDQRILVAERLIAVVDGRFAMKFEYDATINAAILSAPGAYYNKGWSAPPYLGSTAMIARLMSEFGFLATAGAMTALELSRTAEPPPPPVKLPPAMAFYDGPGELGISFPFIASWVDAIRDLPRDQRRWDGQERRWWVSDNPSTLEMLAAALEVAEPSVPAENLEVIRRSIEAANDPISPGFGHPD